MIAALKSSVELRKTSHCVVMRDTAASYLKTKRLPPLEAVVLSLCDGGRDAAAIAELLPERLTNALSGDSLDYVEDTLNRRKDYLDFKDAPVSGKQRYNPADFLFVPKKLTDTGRYVSPVTATLSITYSCNFRCVYCYNDSGTKKQTELDTNDWLEITRQLSEETDCQSILLTGGEPLIHPGFFDILAAGRRAGMIMDFTTNGRLVDDEAVRRFVDLGIGFVRVSLDSPFADVHHSLSQTKDTFMKVTHAIEAMAKAGISVGTKGILYDGNCKDVVALTRFAESLGASEVMLDAYDHTNVGRGKSSMTLSEENYTAVCEDRKNVTGKVVYSTRNNSYLWHDEGDLPICNAWRTSMTVLPSGVFPFCETLADDPFFVLGRFPHDSVMSAWHSPKIDEIHNPKKTQCDDKCVSCKFFERCRTGCFKNKALAGLGYYDRDPYCRID